MLIGVLFGIDYTKIQICYFLKKIAKILPKKIFFSKKGFWNSLRFNGPIKVIAMCCKGDEIVGK